MAGQAQSDQRRQDAAALAKKLRASIWQAGRTLVLKFRVEDIEGRIELAPKAAFSSDRALFQMPRPQPLVLEIFREPPGYALDRFFGAEDLQVGEAGFDERYVIRGKPSAMAVAFMTPQARRLIHSLGAKENFCVRLSPERLEVRYEGAAPNLDGLTRFANDSIGLALLAAHVHNSSDVQVAAVRFEAGSCPVCGGRVEQDRVECALCGTPCHARCWEYNGKCAVFACASTDSRPPDRRTAAPERTPPTAGQKREGLRDKIERLIFPLPRRKKRG